MNEQPCVFCAIVRGEAEASVVYQDGTVLALMDLQPVTPGHLLVIPRAHVVGLADLDTATGTAIWRRAHQLAGALRRSGLRCEGVNFFLADGEAAFQEVFHLHLHVFPRFAGDPFRISADWRARPRAELDANAALIRAVSD
ncbi:HIT family protein [Streptomyces sp. NBRC 109706]|uniref:HIT family protein n=1 Tax=Streptomyces sp. NBRC 109706 TaxID=1550035 RepID=UPI000784F7BE|nr:HIT family protein [Streptomyces sp. NBRC 109706]